MQGGFAKLVALVGGIAAGLIVLAVVVTSLPASPAVEDGPAVAEPARPTATAPAARPTPTAQPTLAPRTPSPAPAGGPISVSSLAELAALGPSASGQPVRVVLSEAELARQTTAYLKSQGTTQVEDVRVRVTEERITVTGTAREGILAVAFTVTGRPRVEQGNLKLVIDSVEPAIISQVSSVAPGQVIDLNQDFEARSVTMTDGQLIVEGVAR